MALSPISSSTRITALRPNPVVTLRFKGQSEEGTEAKPSPQHPRKHYFVKGLKYSFGALLLPLGLYYSLDATGVTTFLVEKSEVFKSLLGEGFGHLGSCGSLHLVWKAGKSFWQALTVKKPNPLTK